MPKTIASTKSAANDLLTQLDCFDINLVHIIIDFLLPGAHSSANSKSKEGGRTGKLLNTFFLEKLFLGHIFSKISFLGHIFSTDPFLDHIYKKISFFFHIFSTNSFVDHIFSKISFVDHIFLKISFSNHQDTSSFDIVKATQYGAFDRVQEIIESA